MGAKVDFLEQASARAVGAAAPAPVIRLPSAAVKTDAGASVVWIVREGKLVRRAVQTGPVSAGFLEVRSGLNGGEQILVGGVDAPTEGMKVKVPNTTVDGSRRNQDVYKSFKRKRRRSTSTPASPSISRNAASLRSWTFGSGKSTLLNSWRVSTSRRAAAASRIGGERCQRHSSPIGGRARLASSSVATCCRAHRAAERRVPLAHEFSKRIAPSNNMRRDGC